MRHPLQDIWDRKNKLSEMIAMIYSCSPMIAKIDNGQVEIIHEVSDDDKKRISDLETMVNYCNDIERQYFNKERTE